MAKARYIGKYKDKFTPAVHLFYEYRGHEYMVTDEHNGYSTPMHVKHKQEQERIDREIEDSMKPKKEWTYEGSAQEGLDLFWKLIEEE